MNVDNTLFYPCLPDILLNIAEAHFVAVDLELSGVPTKKQRPGGGKSSLQERYLETKEAAERYQILQIGVTCVRQDVEKGTYLFHPYNFDLSPLVQERGLDIERIFSFQSGAAEFLLKVGFDIGRPFRDGVPYLSRAESREARQKHARRLDKSAVADIQIKPTEVESLAFLERVRAAVNAWLPRVHSRHMSIGPGGVTYPEDDLPAEELSRFEKRLVHQIVRAEYPDLVTFSKRGCIQVQRYDKEREDRIRAERDRELEERINRQKGFRWVVDALLGGQVDRFDLHDCTHISIDGLDPAPNLDDCRAKVQRAQSHLRYNPRVLVGHNCFLDLIYIYRTFVGVLPDTVEEFAQKLHDLWPTIVDTKYMSTHNCGDINPVSALEQIAHQLSDQEKPILELDSRHSKYANVEAYHEAGYDSFLTAQIMVRLSSKLFKEDNYADVVDQKTNDAENGVAGLSLMDDTTVASTMSSTMNGSSDSSKENRSVRTHRYIPADKNTARVTDGMPRFDTEFWQIYGNKLRVFGTEEAVCVLGNAPPAEEAISPLDNDVSGGVRLE